MKTNKALYFLIISLLIPILSNAANIQQRPVLNKSYGAIKLMPYNYGYGLKNIENKKDYGYGNIIQQKQKTSIFNSIFNSIKNIFSKRKTK